MRRIFQPLSPALNVHFEDAVLRFRQHRKIVDKEAEVCHMIEEKDARDLVVRNHAAAEARERRKHDLHDSTFLWLMDLRESTESSTLLIVQNR